MQLPALRLRDEKIDWSRDEESSLEEPRGRSDFRRKAALLEIALHPQTLASKGFPAQVVVMPSLDSTAALGAAPTLSASVLLRDCIELFKARVVALVIVTGWGGFYLGAMQSGASALQMGLLTTLAGIGLVSGGAGALNEALERRTDALMPRTANRPIASGRMSSASGVVIGSAAVLLGSLCLLFFANQLTAVLALLTAFLYAAVYTPLKRRTVWATFIGAFPGAMGPMLGWTAARGRIEPPAIALFAILFVWQFPHFMSIAWLYRHEYARAGIRMLPVAHEDGVSTFVVALLFAVANIPVSMIPAALGAAATPYVLFSGVLGIAYLAAAVRFSRILKRSDEQAGRASARNLLRASVLYLPLLFTALMMCATRVR